MSTYITPEAPMTTTVVTRSKTTEQDARIAHAQRRLPLTSRSLSGEEELTITSSDISRTLPALSQPIFAKAARKQVRWGLSPESRIEMVNAARKGPLTSDLLRCFLFRFYSPKPALWVRSRLLSHCHSLIRFFPLFRLANTFRCAQPIPTDPGRRQRMRSF